MDVIHHHGPYVPGLDLRLDPTRAQPFAVISHAHSDHVRPHREAVVTEGTARLLRDGLRPGRTLRVLPYGRRTNFGEFDLTLLPAGHMLGSAQVLVEARGVRLLYSGDFKLRPSASAEPIQVPEADVLIMEATFGRPEYIFPERERVVADIVRFCRDALERGCTPVLFGYRLGKSQELLACLAEEGFRFLLHPSLEGPVRAYQELGVRFPPFQIFRPGAADGCVVVCPPGAARREVLDGVARPRTAQVSGWAVGRGAPYRFRTHAAFPLSDHADYEDLLTYAGLVRPRRVYTVYGFAEDFARDLRRRGYDARPLTQASQLTLPGLP